MPEGSAESGSRPRADRQDLALRPDGTLAPAAASGPERRHAHHLPALQWHRRDPRHRIVGPARAACAAGRGHEGKHRRRARPGAGGGGHLPAQRETHRDRHAGSPAEGRDRADPQQVHRDPALQPGTPQARRRASAQLSCQLHDGRGQRRGKHLPRQQVPPAGQPSGSGGQEHHPRAAARTGAQPASSGHPGTGCPCTRWPDRPHPRPVRLGRRHPRHPARGPAVACHAPGPYPPAGRHRKWPERAQRTWRTRPSQRAR